MRFSQFEDEKNMTYAMPLSVIILDNSSLHIHYNLKYNSLPQNFTVIFLNNYNGINNDIFTFTFQNAILGVS